MARYTIELRDLLVDINAKQEIDKALSTYPIYKPQSDNPDIVELIPTRETLNKKLLNHYKYREIGFDTPGRFIDELEITMNEIMPYYNEMFKSVETMHNIPSPFDNVDVTETFKEERTGSSTSTDSGSVKEEKTETSNSTDSGTTTSNAEDSTTTNSNVESNSKNVESTTPQGELSIPGSAIDSVGYADKVTWNKNSSNDVATSSGNSSTEATTENSATSSGNSSTDTTTQNSGSSESSEIVEHTYTKKGNQGVNTYAHDMNEFRTSIIDVTMQIIEDRKIKDLFMQVF